MKARRGKEKRTKVDDISSGDVAKRGGERSGEELGGLVTQAWRES